MYLLDRVPQGIRLRQIILIMVVVNIDLWTNIKDVKRQEKRLSLYLHAWSYIEAVISIALVLAMVPLLKLSII